MRPGNDRVCTRYRMCLPACYGRKYSPSSSCGGGEGIRRQEKKNIKLKSDQVSRRMFRVSQTRLFTHYLAANSTLSRTILGIAASNRTSLRYVIVMKVENLFSPYFFSSFLNGKLFCYDLFSKTHFLLRVETGINARCVRPSSE